MRIAHPLPWLAFGLVACHSLSPAPGTQVPSGSPTQDLLGHVYDIWDQTPIEHASVRLADFNGPVAFSDNQGTFRLGPIPDGLHTVQIESRDETFRLKDVRVETGGRPLWQLGLPTRAGIAAMEANLKGEGVAANKMKGWSALPSGVVVAPSVERVRAGWAELASQYRAATDRCMASQSLDGFAQVVPRPTRLAAYLAYLQHKGEFAAHASGEILAIPAGALFAQMIATMEVVEIRASTDYPYGVDVFLADDRIVPPPDINNLTRTNTPSMLVTEFDGHLVLAAISPAMAEGLQKLWRAVLAGGWPRQPVEASDEAPSGAARPKPLTLFDRLASKFQFDDEICLQCEDLLTEAIVAKHLSGSQPIERNDSSPACSRPCARRLGKETIVLEAECGLKNERAQRFNTTSRRINDDPIIETSTTASGATAVDAVVLADNDTPCVFSIKRERPMSLPNRTQEVIALAKDIAAVATPELLKRSPNRIRKGGSSR